MKHLSYTEVEDVFVALPMPTSGKRSWQETTGLEPEGLTDCLEAGSVEENPYRWVVPVRCYNSHDKSSRNAMTGNSNDDDDDLVEDHVSELTQPATHHYRKPSWLRLDTDDDDDNLAVQTTQEKNKASDSSPIETAVVYWQDDETVLLPLMHPQTMGSNIKHYGDDDDDDAHSCHSMHNNGIPLVLPANMEQLQKSVHSTVIWLGILIGCFVQLSSLGSSYIISVLELSPSKPEQQSDHHWIVAPGEDEFIDSSTASNMAMLNEHRTTTTPPQKILWFSFCSTGLSSAVGVILFALVRSLLLKTLDQLGGVVSRASLRHKMTHRLEARFAVGALGGVCLAWMVTDILLGLHGHLIQSMGIYAIAMIVSKAMGLTNQCHREPRKSQSVVPSKDSALDNMNDNDNDDEVGTDTASSLSEAETIELIREDDNGSINGYDGNSLSDLVLSNQSATKPATKMELSNHEALHNTFKARSWVMGMLVGCFVQISSLGANYLLLTLARIRRHNQQVVAALHHPLDEEHNGPTTMLLDHWNVGSWLLAMEDDDHQNHHVQRTSNDILVFCFCWSVVTSCLGVLVLVAIRQLLYVVLTAAAPSDLSPSQSLLSSSSSSSTSSSWPPSLLMVPHATQLHLQPHRTTVTVTPTTPTRKNRMMKIMMTTIHPFLSSVELYFAVGALLGANLAALTTDTVLWLVLMETYTTYASQHTDDDHDMKANHNGDRLYGGDAAAASTPHSISILTMLGWQSVLTIMVCAALILSRYQAPEKYHH